MSAREPLAAAQVECFERLLAGVTPGARSARARAGCGLQVVAEGAGPVAWGVRTAGDADFIVAAPEMVELLIAEVARLTGELADSQAMLAKTVDNMQALLVDGDLTVYRAEHSTIPLDLYLFGGDAEAHAEDKYRELNGPAPELSWRGEPEDDSVLRLYAEHEGDEVETAFRVVPVTVLAEYDPDGES
jgi:hypothetical protein